MYEGEIPIVDLRTPLASSDRDEKMNLFTRGRLLNAGLLSLFLGVNFLIAREALQQMKTVAKQSAQYALFVEIVDQLELYKSQHGEYPPKLDVMQFQYYDGGDASLLQLFEFETDGASYSLHSVGVATHTDLIAHSTEDKPNVEFRPRPE